MMNIIVTCGFLGPDDPITHAPAQVTVGPVAVDKTDEELLELFEAFSKFEKQSHITVDHSGSPGIEYNLDCPDVADNEHGALADAYAIMAYAMKLVAGRRER